jgi:hypothetical protein
MTNARSLKIGGGPHDGQTREVECDCDNIVLTHRTVVWKWDVTDATLAANENHTYVVHCLRTGPTRGDEFAFLTTRPPPGSRPSEIMAAAISASL